LIRIDETNINYAKDREKIKILNHVVPVKHRKESYKNRLALCFHCGTYIFVPPLGFTSLLVLTFTGYEFRLVAHTVLSDTLPFPFKNSYKSSQNSFAQNYVPVDTEHNNDAHSVYDSVIPEGKSPL
jgi:hypothetical protein